MVGSMATKTFFKQANCRMYLRIGSGDMSIRKMAGEVGISHKHVRVLLIQWMGDGLLVREDRGKYVYTAKGLEMCMIIQELEANLGVREFQ